MEDEPVDLLSLTIAYLLSQGRLAALVEGRIAGAHRFSQADGPDGEARGWTTPAKALTLRYAGADGRDPANCPDSAMERGRLEVRCWGESQVEAARVWAELRTVVRRFVRVAVALPDGRSALLSVLAVIDGPEGETDPDTRIDYLRGNLRVWAHTQALITT